METSPNRIIESLGSHSRPTPISRTRVDSNRFRMLLRVVRTRDQLLSFGSTDHEQVTSENVNFCTCVIEELSRIFSVITGTKLGFFFRIQYSQVHRS